MGLYLLLLKFLSWMGKQSEFILYRYFATLHKLRIWIGGHYSSNSRIFNCFVADNLVHFPQGLE